MLKKPGKTSSAKFFAKKDKKTIRPLKKHQVGTKRYELHKLAKRTLGSGAAVSVEQMKSGVKLPAGEDLNEWLAVHGISLSISLLFLKIFTRYFY
jgi:MOB kinase activator 1